MKKTKILNLLLAVSFVVLCIAGILFINYQIIGTWFGKDGPANIGSIEVSYVSMARFLVDYGFRSWSPFWYFGFPTHLFYTPLLPFLEVLLHKFFLMHYWVAYRFITGIAYIVGPVSLFFLGWQLSKRAIGGLIAGLLYTVGPTLLYFIDPGVASDKFSELFWDPRRFTILVRWGEGPHLLSLVFLPLVGVFYARYLDKNNLRNLFLSAVFLGLAGLTNAIGFFASIILVLSMTFVQIAQKKDKKYSAAISSFLVGALAFGLISFWYNLSFVTNFFAEGGGIGNALLSLMPWGIVGCFFVLTFVYWFFSKVLKHFGIASSLFYFLIVFTVVATYYLSASAGESYRRIELLPQALRYNVEVDLAFSLLIGVIVGAVINLLVAKINDRKHLVYSALLIETVLGVIIFLASYTYVLQFLPTARASAGSFVDLSKTREYEIASWLSAHTDVKKGERVFVPGNYGFYLNWFSDVWQHRGGLFQAATHFWPDHMHYQMANGKNVDIAKAWLVAVNAKYAVITTGASSELYKEMKNLDRFSNLPVALKEKGDIIYEVPLRRPSLAKPVSLSQMANLSIPQKADDKKPLLAYSDWVEDSSINKTSFTVTDNDRYIIEGDISEGEGILIQMTWDPGWKALNALQNGKSIGIGKDPMGFLVLYPPAGKVDIVLLHGKTPVIWLGYIISVVSILLVVIVYVRNRREVKIGKKNDR